MATEDELFKSHLTTYRCIEEPDTTRYLVGCRGATLVPFDSSEKIAFPAHPGTLRIALAEGKSLKNVTRVYAEDLYLYAGSNFDFPGKTVIISAHRIFSIKAPGSTATSITFNCAATKDDTTSKAPDPNPKKASPNTYKETMSDMSQSISQATKANDGADSPLPASSGGNFFITGQLVNLAETDISIVVDCSGAQGGRGQDGGNGGNGADGAVVRTEGKAPREVANGTDGSDGGKGGKGGTGGNGGFLFDLTHVDASSDVGTKHEFSVDLQASKVAGGLGGLGGSGGNQGTGGQAGSYTEWYSIMIGSPPYMFPYTKEKPTEQGSKGGDGQPGAKGEDGADSTVHGCAYSRSCIDEAAAGTFLALSTDLLHLSMIIHRCLFEYQLLSCTQAFQDVEEAQMSDRRNYATTLAWLQRTMKLLEADPAVTSDLLLKMVPSHMNEGNKARTATDALDLFRSQLLSRWTSSSEGRAQILKSFKLMPIDGDPRKIVDMYMQPISRIAQPNLALSDLEQGIGKLEFLEARRAEIFSALTDIDTARTKRAVAAEALKKTLEKYDKDRADLETQLNHQYDVVANAKGKTFQLQSDVTQALERFWSTAQSQVSCASIKHLVDAVSLVCMFVQPEISEVFALGAAGSAGVAASDVGSEIDTDKGPIKKEALQGKIIVLEKGLRKNALKAQLETKSGDIRSLTGANAQYVSAIIAERDAFEELCDEQFATLESQYKDSQMLKAISAAKGLFNDLVDAAQDLHNGVAEYNRLALALTKLEVGNERAQKHLGSLQAQNIDVNMPFLDMINGFYTDVYAFQKAKVIKFLFNVVRACNAVFLQRSSVTDDLVRLGSFENITADLLRASCTVRLADDVDNFLSTWNSHEPYIIHDREKVFTPQTHPRLFDTLKESRRFPFFITQSNAVKLYGFEANWFDVRLMDVHIFLVGATNKNASSDPGTQVIDVTVELGNVFTVTDQYYKLFSFEVPQSTMLFEYNYSQGPDKYEPKSEKAAAQLGYFNFAIPVENRTSLFFSTPIRSPFSKWAVSVSDSINVDHVEKVIVQFDLRVRTSSNTPPTSTGS